MCFIYDDYADVYDVTTPKARKEHKCTECNKPIEKGSVYHRVKMLFEGNWDVFKLCQFCQDLREAVYKKERKEGCDETESWIPLGCLYSY